MNEVIETTEATNEVTGVDATPVETTEEVVTEEVVETVE